MRAPLGKNEICKLMKTAAQSAGLQGNFTNHTVRKTCISRLMDAEVSLNYVAQLSGHKNLKSLDSYKAASADHQRKMSLILSRSGQESIQTSTVSVYENTTLPANLPKDVSEGFYHRPTPDYHNHFTKKGAEITMENFPIQRN